MLKFYFIIQVKWEQSLCFRVGGFTFLPELCKASFNHEFGAIQSLSKESDPDLTMFSKTS